MTGNGIPEVSKINPLKKKLLPKKQTTEYNAVSGKPGSYQKGGNGILSRIIVKGSLHVSPQGIYHIKYRIIDPVTGPSKSKSKSTGYRAKDNTKRKAEQYMKDFFAELEEQLNAVPVIEPENPPFSVYVNRWLEGQVKFVEPNTMKSYRDYARVHVIPMLGDILIRDCSIQILKDFCDKLLEDHAISSVRKILVVVKGAFAEAMTDGVIQMDPSYYVKLPKEKPKEKKFYTPQQLAVLMKEAEQAGEPIRAAILLASCYGLRREEALGLRWQDIDFEAGTLTVRNTVTQNGALKLEREQTKSKKSRRILWLLTETVPYLKELRETQQQAGLTLDKVCVWPDGRQVRPDYVYRKAQSLMKQAGLPVITYHDLRRTASTIMASHVTLKQLQDFMGHEDAGTTMNIYTQIMDEDKKKASEAMNEVLKNEVFCSAPRSTPDNVG